MALRDGFDVRQAPGWWPSLVIVTHRECGRQSGTINLNTSSYLNPAERWMMLHRCDEER